VLEIEPGIHLAESNAILWYLGEGTRFVPEGRLGRAQALQWMFFEQYSHEPNIATPRYWITHNVLTPEREALLPGKRKLGYDALAVMERHLERRAYFAGERYSLADIALYAYTHVAAEGGFDLAAFPAVRRWLDRVAGEKGHVSIAHC
jgi:glutathione S-transferase